MVLKKLKIRKSMNIVKLFAESIYRFGSTGQKRLEQKAHHDTCGDG